MSFTDAKDLQASRKFELVRITPARYIVDDLVSVGSGRYTYATNYFISSIKENGTELTRVTGTPNSGEYAYDSSTGILTVYPSNPLSSTNPIVMFYHLFFTGEVYRTWYENPEDDTTPLRDWQPLIKKSPEVGQSIENLLAGILTISTSNIEIINNNYDLNQYFTSNDSFYNKEVKIWLCLDSELNIQKIFEGRVVYAQIDKVSIVLTIQDNLVLLDNPALMGDSASEAYFRLDDYPNLNSSSNGTCRPYIIGTCSRYQTLTESVTNLSTAKRLDHSTLYLAVCLNFDNNLSNTVNRSWGLCRTSSAGFQNISITVLSVDNSDPNFTKFTCNPTDIGRVYIGDTFIINQGSDYYFRVWFVDRASNYIFGSPVGVTGTPTLQSNNCPSIVILHDEKYYYPMYGRDYIATVTTTSGGNKSLDITFSTNLESNLGFVEPLDPTIDEIGFRVRPAKMYHGELLQKIFESAGLTVDASSITTANTDLPVYAAVSIPKYDESDYESYLTYAEHVLESTFSYVYMNNNFEIEYKLFSDPVSTDQITDTEIIKGSFSVSIDYQDIISQLIAYNPHANSIEFVDKTGTSLESKKSECLHGFSRTTRFQHCLEDITSRLSQIIKYRSNRVAKYSTQTVTKNLDSHLGEDFILVKSGLLGELSKQVKLISISKGSNRSKLILTDLGV